MQRKQISWILPRPSWKCSAMSCLNCACAASVHSSAAIPSWLTTRPLLRTRARQNCAHESHLVSQIKNYFLTYKQCCGSVTFCYGPGSRSADQYLWLTDRDLDPAPTLDLAPDPAIFVSDLQDGNKNFFFFQFSCLLPFEATFTSF